MGGGESLAFLDGRALHFLGVLIISRTRQLVLNGVWPSTHLDSHSLLA